MRMKCQEVNELLIVYSDDEVTLSERTLIRSHLAECDFCQKKLAALSATQGRVSRSLQVRAAQAAPSPQAWSHLQARLAGEARPSSSWLPTRLQRLTPDVGRINQIFTGGLTMKKGFALAAFAALVVAVSTVAFVPSVRAQVGQVLNTWFHFKSPGGEYAVIMSGPMEFTPLQPTYLPAGLQGSGGISALDTGSESEVELAYYNDEQFVAITQSKALADKALPAGRDVTVNGQPAVLVGGLEGTFEYGFRGFRYGFRIPEGTQMETVGTPPAGPVPIAYTDGKRLTWYVGDVRVEMLSNLPEEEILKIAESMTPAEAGEGEASFDPSLDLPSSDEGKVIETEGGHIIIQEGSIKSNP